MQFYVLYRFGGKVRKICMSFTRDLLRFSYADLLKSDRVPRGKLRRLRNIGGYHGGDLRVTARGLMICKKKYRLTVYRHLNRAAADPVREYIGSGD